MELRGVMVIDPNMEVEGRARIALDVVKFQMNGIFLLLAYT